MGQEFELKYRATPGQIAAIRDAFGPFREISMETTYYDALDHSLSARRWTLRRRFENGISVCTLKTPGENGVRGEWETEWGDIRSAATELCKLGAPAELTGLVQNGLVEVCGAAFTRLAATLSPENCTIELALDQGVLLGGGKELPLREVEVELKSGSEAAAVAFANLLAEKYGLIPEHRSKYKRALTLALEK